ALPVTSIPSSDYGSSRFTAEGQNIRINPSYTQTDGAVQVKFNPANEYSKLSSRALKKIGEDLAVRGENLQVVAREHPEILKKLALHLMATEAKEKLAKGVEAEELEDFYRHIIDQENWEYFASIINLNNIPHVPNIPEQINGSHFEDRTSKTPSSQAG